MTITYSSIQINPKLSLTKKAIKQTIDQTFDKIKKIFCKTTIDLNFGFICLKFNDIVSKM